MTTRESTQQPGPSVHSEHHVLFEASPAAVWELLTAPEHVSTWLGDDVDLPLVPHGVGRLVDFDGTERHVRVDSVAPHRSLQWTWWPADRDEPSDPLPLASVVELTLVPCEEGTLLHVVETAPTALTASARASASNAWSTRLVALELLVLTSCSLVAAFAGR